MAESRPTPLTRLLRRLAVEQLDRDLFLGSSGRGEGALFGGLVAAQSAVAAARTVADRQLHSLHGYFLRPGKHNVPIRFIVDRIRDGRTFATRSVVAHQAGEAIFHLSASFTKPEDGIAHQDSLPPAAPEPETLPDWEDVRATLLGDPTKRRPDGPIEVRVCDPDSPDPNVKLAPRRRVWLRPRGPVPDDPLVHTALLIFASDRTLLRTAARPHGLTWRLRTGASLDHAVWFHHPPRFDDWILFATESPVAHAARALLLGAMYDRNGTRVVSVAQEGLLRR
ncbi:MAG: thioesterase family protein [Deltaproteobacteria bacterium]|nr:thioesterase family protein [Deltaproteobacteria bacterium]MBI3387440.1 thioesterase family protein [Deltaproteobacteria bacterium]